MLTIFKIKEQLFPMTIVYIYVRENSNILIGDLTKRNIINLFN